MFIMAKRSLWLNGVDGRWEVLASSLFGRFALDKLHGSHSRVLFEIAAEEREIAEIVFTSQHLHRRVAGAER